MDHKHYVPILKAKAGEKWALENLKSQSRKRITPLLELPPIRKENRVPVKTLAKHLEDTAALILASIGSANCYIDTKWLHHLHGDAALTDFFAEARRQGVSAIPVIQPTSDAATLAAAAAIIAQDNRGALLRVKHSDLSKPTAILQSLAAVKLGPKSTDFLLDYRNQSMALLVDVPLIAAISPIVDWRAFIAASGVFPESVAKYDNGIWNPLPRTCWATWKAGNKPPNRLATFSDYVVRGTGAPGSGGRPPVTLRYTTDQNWLVRVDGTLSGGHAKRMHALCAELIQKKEFAGAAFSAGDLEIENTATKVNPKPGGATQWLQWAENHHMEHVVAQLA